MQAPTGVNNTPLCSVQSQMLEVMQLTDCFYRTMHFYEYVAAVDTDEVIIPMRPEDYTWQDLFKRRVDMTKGLVSFMVSNTIFLPHSKPSNPDFPAYHHMLQQTFVSLLRSNSL
jgi:hypothetical protein